MSISTYKKDNKAVTGTFVLIWLSAIHFKPDNTQSIQKTIMPIS